MKKGKYILSKSEESALFTLRRRKRELKKRIEENIGSLEALSFDKKEIHAIKTIIHLIKELTIEESQYTTKFEHETEKELKGFNGHKNSN